MSTALVNDVRASPEGADREIVLDPTTRQRMAVAACAVETLEELADNGAWERMDAALAEHLTQHARRLCGFLERVRHLPAVRSCESEMLAVRRIERRLEVALDLLGDERAEPGAPRPAGERARKGKGGDEVFLGDFTNATLTEDQRAKVRERRQAKKKAKELLSPRGKRILGYVAACLVLTGASVLMLLLGALQGQPPARQASLPSEEPMSRNSHLEDLQVFLPAKMMAVQRGTAIVMVKREWLLKSPGERQVDADGAHVFLQNRAIPRMELFWEDGGLIARADRDGHAEFMEGTSGLIGREVEASAEPGEGAGPPAGPGAPLAPTSP